MDMYPRQDSQGAPCQKWNHPWAEFRAPNLKGRPVFGSPWASVGGQKFKGATLQLHRTFKIQLQLEAPNLKGRPCRRHKI
eukprot:6481754-Amphidinium_carterae.1